VSTIGSGFRGRGDQGRRDQRTLCGGDEHHECAGPDHGSGDREEPSVADLTEPAGVADPDHVECQEAQSDDRQRLGGHPQPTPVERDGEAQRGAGEGDENAGATADTEPAPRHGQERHRCDEEAQRAQREQDLRH
jgi:hypothetical protein